MWELDHKQSWAPKNWCFWTAVLEKTLESPLDCKEIQPVHLKINQSWIFIGRTDAEAETPILWPPDAKNWLMWKDWCWERLKAGGEGDNGWMDLVAWWTRVWVSSRSWWWTGMPGMLQSMGSQRVTLRLSDWTELKSMCLPTLRCPLALEEVMGVVLINGLWGDVSRFPSHLKHLKPGEWWPLFFQLPLPFLEVALKGQCHKTEVT